MKNVYIKMLKDLYHEDNKGNFKNIKKYLGNDITKIFESITERSNIYPGGLMVKNITYSTLEGSKGYDITLIDLNGKYIEYKLIDPNNKIYE